LIPEALPLGVLLLRHEKKPFARTLCRPKLADVLSFLGVLGINEMRTMLNLKGDRWLPLLFLSSLPTASHLVV
jgi:hypothetical protein